MLNVLCKFSTASIYVRWGKILIWKVGEGRYFQLKDLVIYILRNQNTFRSMKWNPISLFEWVRTNIFFLGQDIWQDLISGLEKSKSWGVIYIHNVHPCIRPIPSQRHSLTSYFSYLADNDRVLDMIEKAHGSIKDCQLDILQVSIGCRIYLSGCW